MIYIAHNKQLPSPQPNLFSDGDERLSQESHGVFHDGCGGDGGDQEPTS